MMGIVAIEHGRNRTPRRAPRRLHRLGFLLGWFAALMISAARPQVASAESYEEAMAQGDALFQQKKYAEAGERFLAASCLKPDSARSLLRTADAYLKQENQAQALEYYKQAFALDHSGEYLAPLYRLGKKFYDAQEWDQALDVYRFIYDKKNRHPNYALKIIDVLNHQNDAKAIVAICRETLEQFDWTQLMQNQREAYHERLEQRLSQALAALGELRPMIEEMLEAWRADPKGYAKQERLRQLCIFALEGSSKVSPEEVRWHINALLELDGGAASSHLQLARELRRLELDDQALELLRLGQERFKDDTSFWIEESEIRANRMELGEALHAAEQAYKIVLNRLEAERKEWTQARQGGDQAAETEARAQLNAAIADAIPALRCYLDALCGISQYEQALDEMDRLEKSLNELADLRVEKDRLLLELRNRSRNLRMSGGVYDEILRSAMQACENNPEDPQLLEALADQYLQLGEREAAAQYFWKACRYHELGTELLLRKAEQETRKRNSENARFFYEQFIRNCPDDARIIEALEKYERQWPQQIQGALKPEHREALELIAQTAEQAAKSHSDPAVRAKAAEIHKRCSDILAPSPPFGNVEP
ncbi:hypothetical protein JXA32_15220 [Candidatus Sumerlaeota bacterium]|nr:hypothetical protein [Candidatus Sumerlaeota bacterium]